MQCRFPKPHANLRLFCFPWAGGGASFYMGWGKEVTDDIEVYALCLPGRENRFKEELCTDLKKVIDTIVQTLKDNYFDKPFAFYGHSMGASLAFLVSMELKRLYNKEPEHLFLSGSVALHSPTRDGLILNPSKMSRREFAEKLVQLGGTPHSILENPELMDIFLPIVISDFTMVFEMKYEHIDGQTPLTCPIDYFDGDQDIDHDIKAWRQITSGVFRFHQMPGGHFFLKEPENLKKLCHYINMQLGGYEDIV